MPSNEDSPKHKSDGTNVSEKKIPNTPMSPTQSATEGDLVDADADRLGEGNAPPTASGD